MVYSQTSLWLILGLWSVKSQGKIPRRPEPGLLVLRGGLVEALATEDTWGAQEPARGPPPFTENLDGPSKTAASVLDILNGGKNRDNRGEFGPGPQRVTLASSLPPLNLFSVCKDWGAFKF